MYGYVGNGTVELIDLLGLVDIYVGGAMDENVSHIVESYAASHKGTYFTFDQGDKILKFINSQKPGEPINLIGHSYGGDTAATVAAKSKRCIDSLITIDPVSNLLNRPNMKDVKDGTMLWINIMAESSQGTDFSDVVAGVGGAWNTLPEKDADFFKKVDAHHGGFEKMLKPANDAKSKLPKRACNK